jgi:hypothetical protein
MTDNFFQLPASDRFDALEVARSTSGRPSHILEKDVWVVWTLALMFGSEFGTHLVFKGGTSLSKAYKAIRRFSEDVDLTYDIRQLVPGLPAGTGDVIPPSRNQADKLSKTVKHLLPKFVSEKILPLIVGGLAEARLPARARAETEKIYIEYEPLAEGYGYVEPVVMLEFGARSSGEPCEIREVVCDAASYLQGIIFPQASPRVMRVERTFWEKATAAHVFCHQGTIPSEAFARHWHDLARLDEAGYAQQALADRDVAMAVAVYKNLFFRETDSRGQLIDYRAAVTGHLRLVPTNQALETLRSDYTRMVDEGAMLEESEPFEKLMERCFSIEERANAESSKASGEKQ